MQRFLISGPDLRIDASFSSFNTSCEHRLLISGPDLGIDVSFSPETSFCVHRFLISSPDLRIDASFSPITPFCVHRFLISGSHLGIDAAPSLLHRRMARLSPPYQRSASESNLLCGKVEWFRLQQSSRQRRIARLQQSSRQRRIACLQRRREGAGGDRMPGRRHNPK